ncbi:conserved hypothetical protein [Vibrio nigripulchritudo SO65]|nr:conserved hypothetical protein [Vibrio nigripulchritudo AM115]CCN39175.1 conserved hypothetical protein [Vibrio nigripulchritudo FTn2]CCN67249.1 conserved hypothetical protein [Vibrio nigripulchritudo POn4]CCN78563.1 conserved hypothetical protein [Vibrio nigripulchritudo SO65]
MGIKVVDFPEYLAAVEAQASLFGACMELNLGIAPSQLQNANQSFTDFSPPKELINMWLHANGSEEWNTVFARKGYLTPFDFLSLESSLEMKSRLKQREIQYSNYAEPSLRDPKIQDGWYSQGWYPFAKFASGELVLMIDLNPTEIGTKGQIICFVHDPDTIVHVANSVSEFLVSSLEQIMATPEEFFGDF